MRTQKGFLLILLAQENTHVVQLLYVPIPICQLIIFSFNSFWLVLFFYFAVYTLSIFGSCNLILLWLKIIEGFLLLLHTIHHLFIRQRTENDRWRNPEQTKRNERLLQHFMPYAATRNLALRKHFNIKCITLLLLPFSFTSLCYSFCPKSLRIQ